ncbi:hypothetical protein D3C76_1383520 [compost metagenome]
MTLGLFLFQQRFDLFFGDSPPVVSDRNFKPVVVPAYFNFDSSFVIQPMVQRIFNKRLQNKPRHGHVKQLVIDMNANIELKIIANLLQDQILLERINLLPYG